MLKSCTIFAQKRTTNFQNGTITDSEEENRWFFFSCKTWFLPFFGRAFFSATPHSITGEEGGLFSKIFAVVIYIQLPILDFFKTTYLNLYKNLQMCHFSPSQERNFFKPKRKTINNSSRIISFVNKVEHKSTKWTPT